MLNKLYTDIGYSCTGAIGARSVCVTICGDSIKAGY
jgi:hypothetical protein